MNRLIPCYVSGKGMYATAVTQDFKVAVIDLLESGGLGYDTRYRYYRRQFPDMAAAQLARMICDPIEYYDRDWPAWKAAQAAGKDQDEAVTAFFLERDGHFRSEAQTAIYCFDEAGFGSGINVMRFIHGGKPLLGFYHHTLGERRVSDQFPAGAINIGNILQLAFEYPQQVTLHKYQSLDEILVITSRYLAALGGSD